MSDEQNLPLKDCSDVERENRDLREALTAEAAELARVTVYTASAIGASRLGIGAEMVKLGYVGLREQLAAAQAALAEAIADWSRTDKRVSAKIEADYNARDAAVPLVNAADRMYVTLSQSPTDALAAHDRQVAAKAWDEGRERGLNNREGCICRNADHRTNDPSMHWRNPYAALVSEPTPPEQAEGEKP